MTTPIVHAPRATESQAAAWAASKHASSAWLELIPIFWRECQRRGVDPAAAFAQASKETGFGAFGRAVTPAHHNVAGLKVRHPVGPDDNPDDHVRFASWEEGIGAFADHLALYAGAAPKHWPDQTADQRQFDTIRGTATDVEDLGGKWAPDPRYGTDVVAMVRDMSGPVAQTVHVTGDSPLVSYFAQARYYTPGPRTKGPIIWLVLHTAETPEDEHRAHNLADYCVTPDTPVLTADLRWVPVGDLPVGAELVGVDETTSSRLQRSYRSSYITSTRRRFADAVRLTFEDGRQLTCTLDHGLLRKSQLGGAPWAWAKAGSFKVGDRTLAPLDTWQEDTTYEMGWLAGFLDGEGTLAQGGYVRFAQMPGPVLDRAKGLFAAMGVPVSYRQRPEDGCVIGSVRSRRESLLVLGRVRPLRLLQRRAWEGQRTRGRLLAPELKLVEIDHVGVTEVVAVETSARTYIANGIVSHNCAHNDRRASWHYACDAKEVSQSVRERDVAWAAAGANAQGVHIEHAGRASQDKVVLGAPRVDGWGDAYSQSQLRLSARLAADVCVRNHIPVRFVKAPALQNRQPGITTHYEVDHAFPSTGHIDPGPNFPMAAYVERVERMVKHPWPGSLIKLQTPHLTGEDVVVVQERLVKHRFAAKVDGDYGQEDKDVVKRFQAAKGLAADGVVGWATWDELWSHPAGA